MKITDLNKLINSELTTKIKGSSIENGELMINCDVININPIILFLKSDKNCRFRQLIDILAVDYPNREKRFKIYYLLLSHENNLRIKISSDFRTLVFNFTISNCFLSSPFNVFPDGNFNF